MGDIEQKIDKWANENDTDIIVYFGDIERGQDDSIINQCRARKLRKNILLFLTTRGGDPNAGYRFARCLQEAYKTVGHDDTFSKQNGRAKKEGDFKVFIDGLCKSAGTLICLGADAIIMSGNAELGPIDIQLRKKDEVGERESGLTPIQALQFLQIQSIQLFKRHFMALRFSEDLVFSTKMATEVATELTTGLLSPIYAQIDPIRLAEVDRSMRIAKEYGDRLSNDNLLEGALEKLLVNYPSHGFVIDRTEARKIFKNVLQPDKELREIADFLRDLAEIFINKEKEQLVTFITSPPMEKLLPTEGDNKNGTKK